MMAQTRKPARTADKILGLTALSILASALFFAGGAFALAYATWLWATGALVLFLWRKNSLAAKVFAAILMPAVLLALLLPRNLKRAIRNLEKD